VLGLGHDQARRAGKQGRPEAADRRRFRRRRPALPVPAVRLLLRQGGQRPDRRAAVGEARSDRRDRAGGLEHV